MNHNVALIPVRGGSKSIPLKNIKEICGRPLVYWTIKAATECDYIDKVYVSTDSDIIKDVVNSFIKDSNLENFKKVCVINRSEETATDTASTESVMIEFAERYIFDNIALIQATSPMLDSADITKGFIEFSKFETDSVLSVVKQKRFNWRINKLGFVEPSNYDYYNRPRRQDFNGYLVENGAFYITSRSALLKTRCRISGNIKAVEMAEDTFFEIDEPGDWIIIEDLMRRKIVSKNKSNGRIKLLLSDCDGCLTDGGMYYSENGDESKKFNTRDGVAFRILGEKNIFTGIITGENVELNKRRALKMGVDFLEQGISNKLEVVIGICKKLNITINEVCYIGDDINDIELLKHVGFSCCPANAVSQVKSLVDYVTTAKGGEGVVREVVDLFLL